MVIIICIKGCGSVRFDKDYFCLEVVMYFGVRFLGLLMSKLILWLLSCYFFMFLVSWWVFIGLFVIFKVIMWLFLGIVVKVFLFLSCKICFIFVFFLCLLVGILISLSGILCGKWCWYFVNLVLIYVGILVLMVINCIFKMVYLCFCKG